MIMDEDKAEIKDLMLSTSDNPWNPFTHFKEWMNFDLQMGYNTCSYLAAITEDSDGLGPVEEALSRNLAIEEAMLFNLTGNRIIVEKPKDLVSN